MSCDHGFFVVVFLALHSLLVPIMKRIFFQYKHEKSLLSYKFICIIVFGFNKQFRDAASTVDIIVSTILYGWKCEF